MWAGRRNPDIATGTVTPAVSGLRWGSGGRHQCFGESVAVVGAIGLFIGRGARDGLR